MNRDINKAFSSCLTNAVSNAVSLNRGFPCIDVRIDERPSSYTEGCVWLLDPCTCFDLVHWSFPKRCGDFCMLIPSFALRCCRADFAMTITYQVLEKFLACYLRKILVLYCVRSTGNLNENQITFLPLLTRLA